MVRSAGGKAADELTGPARQMPTRPLVCELDAVPAVGDQISCAMAVMAVHEPGLRAVSSTGGQAGIRTDHGHGNPRQREVRPERITEALDEPACIVEGARVQMVLSASPGERVQAIDELGAAA